MATEDDGQQMRKEKLLAGSFIFQALDEGSKRDLAAYSHTKRYLAGEIIFQMGSPGQSMMAIARGTVRISRLTPTDRDIILAELGPGDVFGEVALLDGGARSAEALALTNCDVLVLERRAVLDVLNRNPKLAIRLVEILCARLRLSDERMMEIAFMDLPARLAKALLRKSAPDGQATPSAKLSVSQTEIANLVGSSRENVNRCLRNWQRCGFVDLRDGWLVILDRTGLEHLASAG